MPCHNYHLPYNTKTCKLETTAKGNFVCVCLFEQQRNSDFEFISVSFTVDYIRYQHTVSLKLYDLKIESVFSLDSSFYIKNSFNKEKKYILGCFYR